MIIQHNLTAMNAQRMFNINTSISAKSTEKLSSGYKINRAADDAAGLTISEKMRSLIRGLNQGSDNIQDGISLVQIADGALAEVNDMLHRMTELSVKSANGTNTDADRAAIQKEISAIKMEIDRISESTEFNTMPIFKGTADPKTGWDGKVTKLVSCSAYEKSGGMSEPYLASDGNYYPSATLDFSHINSQNKDSLYGKEFNFICGWGCGESFKFVFTNGDDSATGLGNRHHTYNVDISSATSGSDIVNKLVQNIANNQPHYKPTPANGPDGAPASHSAMVANASGGKLVVYTNSPSSTSAGATGVYPQGTSGSIDCSSMEGLFYPEPIKGFEIVCSNAHNDSIYIESRFLSCEILGIDKLDVSTADGAKAAIDKIDRATDIVSDMRSDFGAYQNRLEHSFNNNENKAENTTAAESLIRDTDMATEMVTFTLQNVLIQAGQSMMAQANQSTQGVLSLLG